MGVVRGACLVSLCLSWLLVTGAAARSEESLRVLASDQRGFGRVAFLFHGAVPYRLTRDGDHLLLRFETTASIGEPGSLPRNVLGYTTSAGEADIVIAHGARALLVKLANGVAIDVWDAASRNDAGAKPAGGAKPPPAAGVKPALTAVDAALSGPANARLPEVARPAPPPETPQQAGTTPPQPQAPALAAARPPAPAAAAVPSPEPGGSASIEPPSAPAAVTPNEPPQAGAGGTPTLPPTAKSPGTIRLPFSSATGLAALRRGESALLVFDERRPLDPESLGDDPAFAAATVQLMPEGTIIRLKLPSAMALAFGRTPEGWTITAGVPPTERLPITPVFEDRTLKLPAAAPGRVLSVPDPDTGGLLLVATQRESGQAVTVARRTGEFELLPTWQGIAVDPLSASVFLRSDKDGFVLGADPSGLALAPPPAGEEAYAAASTLTRRFDFPPISPEALKRRLQGEVDTVAAAAPLARARGRRAVAETMIALGLAAEAQGMLGLAATEDARALDDADSVGLSAIAALLAGRETETDGLDDKRLDGTDEIAFWRAVRQATVAEGSAQAAAVFARTLPLVLAYPTPLREKLLPLVAETLAANGQPVADKLLSRLSDDPRLRFARGLWLQAKGDRDGALSVFDGLTGGGDRLLRLRAVRRAVELRLAAGRLDAGGAADALQRQLFAWRGDRHEIDLRLRLAELRAKAGTWREALALLRETETLDPEEKPAVHAKLVDTFAAACAEGNVDRLPPLELVTLLDENADLLPAGEPGTDLAARLADRLLALDLPRRAEAVLARLVRATAGPVRASFGARLAALRLREGSPADALATLADTEGEELPPAVQEQRAMVRAGALARRGDATGAARLLADVGTDQAAGMRASILEEAHDWPGAERALTEYVQRTVPPDGALTDPQKRTLLRLAGAASQAGDAAALAALGRREGKRMEAGALGDTFRLLTASPIEGGADLPRAASEIALARSLPSGLKAMGPTGGKP